MTLNLTLAHPVPPFESRPGRVPLAYISSVLLWFEPINRKPETKRFGK